jgi:hypothetical protein
LQRLIKKILDILTSIKRIGDSIDLISELMTKHFGIPIEVSKRLVEKKYRPYINSLKNDLWILVEFPYVDKVYRDSYYSYFSTKLNHNVKDCIRISIFDSKITYSQFRNEKSINRIRKKYLGFIVLRPTPPNITGRSVISPRAFKVIDFNCCTVDVPTTVNSVKMKVNGFPHSSQDTETITCAETTLWACMEYFGFKYSDYKPILPSQITNILGKVSYERQIPSKGLTILQISSALKEFGFGSKVYHSSQYPDNFSTIYSTYIESGIPVIVGLAKNNSPGHAILGIGREILGEEHIEKCGLTKTLQGNIQVYDLDSITKKFVFIDDNFPPYQQSLFDSPCQYYNDPDWQMKRINCFVVPLYSKIYLEAFEAKNFVYDLLSLSLIKSLPNSAIALRFYLASSRSYKDWIASSSGMTAYLREIILNTAMPKFIWVAETGSKESFKQKKANGLVLLDATGANTYDMKPLIIAVNNGILVRFNSKTNDLDYTNFPSNEFLIYERNLKYI